MQVNSSREHSPPGQTPGHTPGIWKNCLNARPYGQFLSANAPPPVPTMMVKYPAPQPSDQYTKLFVAMFNKHNCFSSIELHKTSKKFATPTEKQTKQVFGFFFCFFWSFMVDKCSSPTPIWQCLTAWIPWLWAPSEMATGCYETSFLLFANTRGAGTLSTAKCPALGTHRATNARGLPGGMLAAGIDSYIM